MYFQMLKYYCFVQSCHAYVKCVYISILLVLILGVTCIYINHCTVVFCQFNVLMKNSVSVSTGASLNKAPQQSEVFFLFQTRRF